MQVFISDLNLFRNRPDKIDAMKLKIGRGDAARADNFQSGVRQMQFIVGHAMVADMAGVEVSFDEHGRPYAGDKYISIAHVDRWVVVVVDDMPVGIDIENKNKKRDFAALNREFFGVESNSGDDLYARFVAYEARFKAGNNNAMVRYFVMGDDWIIAIAADAAGDVEWVPCYGTEMPKIVSVDDAR